MKKTAKHNLFLFLMAYYNVRYSIRYNNSVGHRNRQFQLSGPYEAQSKVARVEGVNPSDVIIEDVRPA